MKVSIIIPFYKGSFFLEDALQSLKEQIFKDFEVILICDHIEEDISSLINSYQTDLNLKIYYLQNNRGVAAARNYGISLATGEFIYFLDSDDYIDYHTLEILVNTPRLDNIDIIYGKKVNTWFKRNTYLSNRVQKTVEDEKDDDGENSFDSQSYLETEGKDETEGITYNNRERAYKHLISVKKAARNISILNILIRRELIIKNQINFNENIIYLSDYPFLFQVLHYADTIEYQPDALYIKRKHNDSINYPSLNQMDGSKDFTEYLDTYQYVNRLLETDSILRMIIDKKFLGFYASVFAPCLFINWKDTELRNHFNRMHTFIQTIDKELLGKYYGYKRKLYKALLAGDYNKSVRSVQYHIGCKKIKKIIKNINYRKQFIYKHLLVKKRLKENWVLCESFFGKNYSDSPKYIYEYISSNYPDKYKFIWVINKKDTAIPYNHIKVKRFSLKYFYYLARSKYYIFNGRQPEWTIKREGNVFLQTWHGTPLKKLVFDIDDISSATARYKRQVYNQSRAWDYLIAPNQFSSETFRRCFLYDKEMLETGYPRNDILHSSFKTEKANRIKKELGIPLDKKTILYAPTWRDDEYYAKGKYKFTLQLDLSLLKEQLGKDYVILLRTHYFIADSLDVTGLEGFAYNLSKYDDIAELYLISDVLITDYSSVFFDYANLRRPMLFFMYDLEKYRDILRGFYIDIEEELPGPLLSTTEEVLNAIIHIDKVEEMYKDKYSIFYDKYCAWEDERASEIVAQKVFDL